MWYCHGKYYLTKCLIYVPAQKGLCVLFWCPSDLLLSLNPPLSYNQCIQVMTIELCHRYLWNNFVLLEWRTLLSESFQKCICLSAWPFIFNPVNVCSRSQGQRLPLLVQIPFAWRGFLLCICLRVCLWTRYLKKYLTNQLHFGGSLPCVPGRKTFDFEKKIAPG